MSELHFHGTIWKNFGELRLTCLSPLKINTDNFLRAISNSQGGNGTMDIAKLKQLAYKRFLECLDLDFSSALIFICLQQWYISGHVQYILEFSQIKEKKQNKNELVDCTNTPVGCRPQYLSVALGQPVSPQFRQITVLSL